MLRIPYHPVFSTKSWKPTSTMQLFRFQKAYSPLMVSNPHSGTFILPEIAETMTDAGLEKRDTDWFLSRLYDLPVLESAAMISANLSRYVIDLNRPAGGESLYPGQASTGTVPLITFANRSIYRDGLEPDNGEIAKRIEHYWQPYHDQIRDELSRMVDHFGFAVLLDIHSISQRVPMLFDGDLPDFNFGTNRGRSCGTPVQELVEQFSGQIKGYSSVVNGRFIGGYITRNYGGMENVNAIQLELNRWTYMDEETLTWEFEKAQAVEPVLESFVVTLLKWAERQIRQ